MKSYKFVFLVVLSSLLATFPTVQCQGNPQTFWGDYPACEEQCHENVWNSQQCSLQNSCGCGSGSACLCLEDSCLCETSSWLSAVAQCVGQSCGAVAVTNAASIVASACSGNGFALAVPSTALVSIGLAAEQATVTSNNPATTTPSTFATTTPSQTSTSSSSSPPTTPAPSGSSSGGLTTSDKIAIGVGLGVGVPPCIVAIYKLGKIWGCIGERAVN